MNYVHIPICFQGEAEKSSQMLSFEQTTFTEIITYMTWLQFQNYLIYSCIIYQERN